MTLEGAVLVLSYSLREATQLSCSLGPEGLGCSRSQTC